MSLEKRCAETLIQYYGRPLWIRSEVQNCAECLDASPFCIELERRIDGTRAELKWHEALSDCEFSSRKICKTDRPTV
jgi:hypothetical protein